MNPVSSLVLSLALLLGAAGGVYAYDSAAHSTPGHPAVSAASVATPDTAAADQASRARRGAKHRTVVRWAPCPDGTRLEAGVCVTDVVRTVTLPAPVAPAAAHSTASTGSTAAQHDDRGDDDGGEHEGEHEGGHGGEGDD